MFSLVHTFAVVPLFNVQGGCVHLHKVDEDTLPVVQNRVHGFGPQIKVPERTCDREVRWVAGASMRTRAGDVGRS